MNRVSVITVASVSLLAGCAGPRVVYHKNDPAVQSSPPEGALSFALRTTDITIDKANAPKKAADGNPNSGDPPADPATSDQTDKKNPAVANANHKRTPPPAPQQSSTTASTVQDACEMAKKWQDCWIGLGTSTTPAAFGDDVYTVVPENHWYAHTALTSTSLDVDGLVPTSITVDYKNQLKTLISDAGAGAAAGASLGPYGIAGGAIIGLVAGVQAAGRSGPGFESFVCKEDLPSDFKPDDVLSAPESPLSLLVPVTLTMSPALFGPQGADTPDKKPCWHLMPNNSQRFVEQSSTASRTGYRGNGWLYRVELDAKVPDGTVSPEIYFQAAPRADFPFSTCRKATVEVVWWKELQDALKINAMSPDYHYLRYNITIADPLHLGATALPRAGSVKLKPLCGPSSVTKSDAAGSPLSDSAQELLKQIKSVKDAQSGKSSDSTKTTDKKKSGSW